MNAKRLVYVGIGLGVMILIGWRRWQAMYMSPAWLLEVRRKGDR